MCSMRNHLDDDLFSSDVRLVEILGWGGAVHRGQKRDEFEDGNNDVGVLMIIVALLHIRG